MHTFIRIYPDRFWLHAKSDSVVPYICILPGSVFAAKSDPIAYLIYACIHAPGSVKFGCKR